MQESSDNTPYAGETPLISVVVAVYNGGEDIERCLSGIDNQDYPNLECILVDDASTDGRAALAARSRDIRLVRLESQRGPAFARNVGAEQAKGDILFFTDADVVLDARAVSIAASILEGDQQLAAVFGSYDDQPGHGAYLSQYRNLLHHWVHQTSRAEAFSFWSGCGAIRKTVFDSLGGFSCDYAVPSIEDIELGARIRRAGHAIRLEKTMLGQHLKHWEFGGMITTDIFRRAVPWMELILREQEIPVDLNLDWGSRVATVAAGLLGLLLILLLFAGQVSAWLPATTLLFILAILGTSSLANSVAGRGAMTGLVVTATVAITFYALVASPAALVPLTLLGTMVAARLKFYQFLFRKRGLAFAMAAVPMQFLHFLGCAIAIPIGLFKHLRASRTDTAASPNADHL